MRIHPVLIRPMREGEAVVRGAEAHHLARVLRVRAGARLRAFDGDGLEADAAVLAVDRGGVTVRLGPVRPGAGEPTRPLTVAVALLKGDQLTELVRVGTELGVSAFRPLLSERGQAELAASRLLRLRRVAVEATKQCGRSRVPAVHPPCRLAELPREGRWLVAHPAAARSFREAAGTLPAGPITVASGPEGGWTPAELGAFEAAGATMVSLGPRVLRAVTAPLAMAAALDLEGR